MNKTYDKISNGNGVDVIFQTSKVYREGSVRASITVAGVTTPVLVAELGDVYLEFEVAPQTGDVIVVEYDILSNTKSRENILYRINRLEELLLKQEADLKELRAALKERISREVFNNWLKALEERLGIEISASNLHGFR